MSDAETRAYEALQARQYARAYDGFQAAVAAADPADADVESRLSLLSCLAQCATMLGRLAEARDAYQRCITACDGDACGPRAAAWSIQGDALHGLAIVCLQQGAFDEARARFEAAFCARERVECWDQAAQSLALLADIERRADARPAFLAAVDRTVRFARDHGLARFADGQQLRRYDAMLQWDPTSRTAEAIQPEVARLRATGADPAFLVDVALLLANHQARIGDERGARATYGEARDSAPPDRQWTVHAWPSRGRSTPRTRSKISRAPRAGSPRSAGPTRC